MAWPVVLVHPYFGVVGKCLRNKQTQTMSLPNCSNGWVPEHLNRDSTKRIPLSEHRHCTSYTAKKNIRITSEGWVRLFLDDNENSGQPRDTLVTYIIRNI